VGVADCLPWQLNVASVLDRLISTCCPRGYGKGQKNKELISAVGSQWILMVKLVFRFLALYDIMFLLLVRSRPGFCTMRSHPDSLAPALLRLAVTMCLQAMMGVFMVLATVCSTWVAVNAGTSRRCSLIPQGCKEYTAIRKGNKMVCRYYGAQQEPSMLKC